MIFTIIGAPSNYSFRYIVSNFIIFKYVQPTTVERGLPAFAV